jgi:predicted permease
MTVFLAILLKIVPLYLLIALGFVAGRYLAASRETVARLLIYIIAPAIIFNSVFTTPLAANVLFLPVLFFALCCLMCIGTFLVSKHIWPDATKNILSFTAGTGNTGYFGIPVAIALFGADVAGLIIILTLGFILYENSLGFYITARGHYSAKESINRLLTLPTIYAFAIALILNTLGVRFGQAYTDFATSFIGAYTVLGMMLIGLGLAGITTYKFDFKFVTASFLAKFIIWPVVVVAIIFLDKALFGFFSDQIYQVMALLSVVPLAANTVAYATELNAHPEKASFAVLLSTLFALFYIPLIVMLFLK